MEQAEDPPTTNFTWTVENPTTGLNTGRFSELFVLGGYKWWILIISNRDDVNYINMYLIAADYTTLPEGWRRYAQCSLAVVNQIDRKHSIVKSKQHHFKATSYHCAFTRFISLTDLCDPSLGYLVNDKLMVEAVVSVLQVPCPLIPAIKATLLFESEDDALSLRKLSVAEELVKSTTASAPSAEALAALETVSHNTESSLATLITDGAYEEFTAALRLLIEQRVFPLSITAVLKGILESLDGEIPKYVAADKELSQVKDFTTQQDEIKAQMKLAMQKCQEKKEIVANYDAKVAELEAELARVKEKRSEAMGTLRTAVDEMEPLKKKIVDSSSISQSFIAKQVKLTVQKGASLGIWLGLKDVLKNYI